MSDAYCESCGSYTWCACEDLKAAGQVVADLFLEQKRLKGILADLILKQKKLVHRMGYNCSQERWIAARLEMYAMANSAEARLKEEVNESN